MKQTKIIIISIFMISIFLLLFLFNLVIRIEEIEQCSNLESKGVMTNYYELVRQPSFNPYCCVYNQLDIKVDADKLENVDISDLKLKMRDER